MITYELTIKLLNKIEYKGILSQKENKFYIRKLIDEDDYNEMIKEILIGKGYIEVSKSSNNPDDIEINVTNFTNLSDFFEFLKNEGFEIEYRKLTKDIKSFSVVADGEDLSPETIAYLKEGTKIIKFAQYLTNFANNIDYEPKIQIRASSYAVDIQEIDIDTNRIYDVLKDINNQVVNTAKYLDDKIYKKLLDSLVELSKINTLEKLFVELGDDKIEITQKTISAIKEKLKTIINNKKFNISVNKNNLRAFDNKKFRVLLDSNKGVLHLHFTAKVFEILLELLSTNENIKLQGYYKSTQTIQIEKVTNDNI